MAGMWGILQAALSTPSRALQANPSLSMPIGMVSPRAAGEPRATFLGREAQPRLLCAVVRVAPLPRVPVSLPRAGFISRPSAAPPPAGLHLPSRFPSSWGVPGSQTCCRCPMSFPREENGRGGSNGGVGEVCAGCLHAPGIRWDLSTHPYPIFLPQPSQRCGFKPLWMSMLTVWLSDKGNHTLWSTEAFFEVAE